MRTKIVTVALAGSLGLTGAALLSPSLASAQTPSPSASASSGATDRLALLKEALKALVTDDTITQAQADKVAAALAETPLGRGGHGHHGPRAGHLTPEAVAEAAGATVAELQASREDGQTLAALAQANGVSRATLIDRLVEAGRAQLAADVKAGTITQAQADEAEATLTQRVTEKVDRVGRGPGGRGGPRGDRGGDTAGGTSSSTPSSGATATPTA